MFNTLFCLLITVRVLGNFWSVVAGVMILLGAVSLVDLLWQLLFS